MPMHASHHQEPTCWMSRYQVQNNLLKCKHRNADDPFPSSEDHAVGLSTFTVMAGLGGSLGYAMGAINWGRLGKANTYVLSRFIRSNIGLYLER